MTFFARQTVILSPDGRVRGAGGDGVARAAGLVALAVAVVVTATASGGARAETPIPAAPARWVTDSSGFLSAPTARELDARLQDYEKQTGHQVIVFIDHTTGGVPIEDWAVRAFKQWGIGRRGRDDGLALFIFSDDHHLRFEVGYGLESALPDARAARIIRDVLVPGIRAGDRDGAVRGGVDAALAALGGAAESPGATEPAPSPAASHVSPAAVIVVLFIVFLFFRMPVMWMLGLMHIGPPGWRTGWRGGGWSSGSGWSSGGGGWSGGGGSGGGGGFSGGGGSSGGGGASGSW